MNHNMFDVCKHGFDLVMNLFRDRMTFTQRHIPIHFNFQINVNLISKHPCVKDIDTENHKVSLGYKKAEDNPWEQLKNNYPIGSTFHAPVVSLTKFGAFVRILPGVDGLVHISEISNDRVEKVSDALKVGDMVDVKLLDVDFDKKRISLSMKALLNDDAE